MQPKTCSRVNDWEKSLARFVVTYFGLIRVHTKIRNVFSLGEKQKFIHVGLKNKRGVERKH